MAKKTKAAAAPAAPIALADRHVGTVKWFNDDKGYGFITPEGTNGGRGIDIFVHYSGVDEMRGDPERRTLQEGERVEYETEQTDRGQQAIHVVVIA